MLVFQFRQILTCGLYLKLLEYLAMDTLKNLQPSSLWSFFTMLKILSIAKLACELAIIRFRIYSSIFTVPHAIKRGSICYVAIHRSYDEL